MPSVPLYRQAKIKGPKVLILSINYAPEVSGFSQHVAMFASHLVRSGYRSVVCTGFPFAPYWHRWSEYRMRWSQEELLDGVAVFRHTHFIPRSPRRIIERLLMEGSFCLSILKTCLKQATDTDLFVYVGAQPSLAMLARILSVLFRKPYIVMINDLAAGAATDVGILRKGVFASFVEQFERAAYATAAGAIVLCEGFKDALEAHGFSPARIRVIRSPVDLSIVRPAPKSMEFRSRHGLSAAHFVVLFAGSMGLKQGMENIVRAAAIVADRCPDVRWILVGDGETRGNVERLIHQLHLSALVKILPFQPAEALSTMFSAADVLLLNQLKTVKNTVIPSKLLTYMAAGRPVVAAVDPDSQGAEIIRQSKGGWVIPPEDPMGLADAILECFASQLTLDAMGHANRRYAQENFDQKKITEAQERFIHNVILHEDCDGPVIV